ncbi:MAG TPA: amidase family protein, partial [Albitalea sp.]|nr:amidase family protein [Albitalea sp.]
MKALHEMGVADVGRALAAREVSSVEITKHLLARVASHEQLGAWLHVDGDAALAQAAAADARRAGGDAGPLVGVPLAHKDIFVTRDLPTTAGSKMLAGYRSPFDATVVHKLARAGTVSLGKLNCD